MRLLSKAGQIVSICLFCFGIGVSRSYAQLGGPPEIIVQPVGVSVLNGDSATFLATAASLTPMTYQWYTTNPSGNGKQKVGSQGTPFLGIMVCTVSNLTYSGNYWVVVKNTAGSMTSSNAPLVVILPSVTNILSVTAGGFMTNGFHLHLAGPSGSNYVIYASSNMVNWKPISTNLAPTGTVDYTDGDATNHAFRYYRGLIQ